MDTPQASRSTAQVREWLRARAAQLEQEIAAVRERSSTPRPEVSDRSGDSAV
jgi:hypothetical protein